MRAISLQSGSTGNCTYVECDGARLLIDAGISGVQAERRLAEHGIDIRAVDALIISHDHADHCRSAGIYCRKYGLPVHVTGPTLEAAGRKTPLGRIDDVRRFDAGDTLRFDGVSVETHPTPHDGVDGVVFVVEGDGARLGVLTDLGHVFDGLAGVIRSLDAVFLESNYDPTMLAEGRYPPFLKRRIAGPGGHISNGEAARLIAGARERLRWACLAHLSEENNRPDLALETARSVLGGALRLEVASRYEPGPLLEV